MRAHDVDVMEFLGVRCPSAAVVWEGRHAELPLHQKMVTPIRVAEVSRLSCASPAVAATWERAKLWLSDPALYAGVRHQGRLPKPRLVEGDMEKMMEAGVIRQFDGTPEGAIRIFTVPELHKARRRPIKWPEEINEVCGRHTLQPMVVISRAQVRKQVRAGDFAMVVDMRQWFDQIPLDVGVQQFFCCDGGERYGQCALTRLAMGQRQATEVATAITARLLDFPHPGVTIAYAADNMRFLGRDREVLVAAFTIFLQRCKKVGVQLNEIETADFEVPAKVSKLVTQAYDFLGESYCHSGTVATMRSTAKTMAKLATTWSERATWTVRRFACHMGVLLYATSTLRLPMARFFAVMRFFAGVARAAQADDEVWERQLRRMPEAVEEELSEWTRAAIANVPAPIPEYDGEEPDIIICTDASGWGYGAIGVHRASGRVQLVQGAWAGGSALRGAGSVLTEPAAVKAALCAMVPPMEEIAVLVLTDHQGLVDAARAGYAKAYSYNELLRWMGENLRATVSIGFIAGVLNPVDDISRGYRNGSTSQERAEIVIGAAQGAQVAVTTSPFGAPLVRAVVG